jgi:hypothetical protein
MLNFSRFSVVISNFHIFNFKLMLKVFEIIDGHLAHVLIVFCVVLLLSQGLEKVSQPPPRLNLLVSCSGKQKSKKSPLDLCLVRKEKENFR